MGKTKSLILLLGILTGTGVSAENGLRAGFASSEFTPPVGVPLAGHSGNTRKMSAEQRQKNQPYAKKFLPSEGVRDPLRTKVMVLERGDDRIIFASLDVVAITRGLRESIYDHVRHRGIQWNQLFITATHTHSGPGNLSKNLLWNMLTMDEFNQEIYNLVTSKTVEAIDAALDHTVPADLYTTSFIDRSKLQVNRANRPDTIDPQANLILARATTGQWLGGMVNFAVHGIAMPASVPLFSADLPGEIERQIEDSLVNSGLPEQRPTLLFIQANAGDINPTARTEADMVTSGRAFGQQASEALGHLRKMSSDWQIVDTEIHLGRAEINVKNCVDAGEIKLRYDLAERLLSQVTYTPISLFFPKNVWISTLRLGDTVFFQWPGELTTIIGQKLKHLAATFGYSSGWVVGLSNNHLSYFTSQWEYTRPEYEACASFYGSTGGNKIIKQHAIHLQKLSSNR